MRRATVLLALMVAPTILAGCAMAPTPGAPPRLDLPAPATGAPVAADPRQLERWWTAFDDATLDRLVDEALANSLDLRAAMARIETARAQVKLVSRDQYPSVDAVAGASRTRATAEGAFTQPGIPLTTNNFRIALQASYETDFWGKFRGATAAAQSDLVATRYAREVVQTIVAADVARNYFNLQAADAQLALLEETLKIREQAIALQIDRRQAGIIGDYELRAAQAERDGVVADIAVAKRAVVEYESALAALLGRSPRDVFAPRLARARTSAWVTLLPAIPAGLPSDLLARRPDVRQAEAQLGAASLRVDVARAAYYPSISLTTALGHEAADLRDLFIAPARIWSLGASLLQPLLGLKAVEANVEARNAAREEVVVAYVKTVQAAFRDAHDALSANQTTREALAAQTARRDKLAQVVELSELRYRSGYSAYLEVLDAERQLLQVQTSQIAAARNVRLAVVDLAKALGGGWSAEAAQAR
jgi:multidrug efflux system outer membrane protein